MYTFFMVTLWSKDVKQINIKCKSITKEYGKIVYIAEFIKSYFYEQIDFL